MDAKGLVLQKQDSLLDRSTFIFLVFKESWWVFSAYIGVAAAYAFMSSGYVSSQRAIQEARASEIVEGLIVNPPSPDNDRQTYIKDTVNRLLKSPKMSEVLRSIFKESEN